MRISGFASGFDINEIVKELMASHSKPMDRLIQQRTWIEWQQEAYKDVAIKLVDFRNNKLTSFRQTSAIDAKKADVTGDSNVLTARATGNALQGTMTIEVEKLATSANKHSNGTIGGLTSGTKLSDINFGDEGISLTGIKINGADVIVNDNTTIDQFIRSINNNQEANVSAFFDYESGKLSISSKKTGSGEIELEGEIFGNTGFNMTLGNAGQNAVLKVNGMQIERESNTFTINGVEITLRGVTSGPSTMINTITDTDKVVDTVKSFIEEYNALIDHVNGQLNQERFRSFAPLTDEQRKEMSESEVKLWEEKARSGLLRSDSILTKTVSDLRTAIIQSVGGMNITQLGITTGDWTQRGKLVLDETKLRAAIEDDPAKAMEIFTHTEGGTNPAQSNMGIFQRMSSIVMNGLEELSKKAGVSRTQTEANYKLLGNSFMDDEIKNVNKRVDDFIRRLNMMEVRYFKQFTAMETAINKFNSQAGALMSFMN